MTKLAQESAIEMVEMGSANLDEILPPSGRLVVAGGDGTLARVVNAVAANLECFEFGLIPTGTGNDLARSLDLFPQPIEDVWQRAISSPTVAIDLIRVTNDKQFYVLNAATSGFGGMVSTDVTSDAKQHWGSMAYWFTAFSKLVSLEESRVRLELDHAAIEMNTFGLGVANGRYVGGGFPVSPKASLRDGLLDVTAVRVLPTVELIAAGVEFMLDRLEHSDRIRTFQSSRVRVVSEPTMPCSFDGETSRMRDTTFEVMPRRLRIVPGPKPVAL